MTNHCCELTYRLSGEYSLIRAGLAISSHQTEGSTSVLPTASIVIHALVKVTGIIVLQQRRATYIIIVADLVLFVTSCKNIRSFRVA